MKVILSGGGTLGPVVPLLAIFDIYKKYQPEAEFIWVGTKNGPEKELIEKYQIPFFAIESGKWRRYFSLRNFLDIFKLMLAFIQSTVLLIQEKPDLLISAGGFVSVPLHWAAAFLGIPAWVHQQDVRPGLANKLIFPWAKKITTALQESVQYFPAKKTEWIGNPVRDLKVENYLVSRQKFNIPEGASVVLAMGGGTGSSKINQMVVEALQHWPKEWHVIHLVGRERPKELAENATKIFENYHVYQFFTDEMKDAYAAADVVISRAGFSSITELASLSKPAVIIPMSDTHQEDNVNYLAKQNAVVALNERLTSGLQLAQVAKDLMNNSVQKMLLGKKLHQLLPPANPEKIIAILKSFQSPV